MLEALDHRIVPANPHFVGASSSVNLDTGALTVTFHEAGLGNNVQVVESLTVDAHATYQWFNHGGQNPQGVPFNVDGTFTVTGTFTSGKNGEIMGSLTVNPPGLNDFLSTHHAANWIPDLTVSYANVVVTDVTNGDSTLDAGFFLDHGPIKIVNV
jgi:hypothetical protein